MIGMKSIDIVHPEDRETIREQAREMLKGRRLSPYEYRIITKDGQIRWIMETVTPIQYKGRRAILGNSMDITAQKEHGRRLQELEALEASILDAIPHAVLGLAKRRIIFANDAVDAVFGWRPEELIGKTTRILYRSDEEYSDIGKFVYSTLRRQRTCSAEIPCRRMDGREIVVRLHASRIGDDLREGRIIAVYEDITKRKRSEKALRESERFNKEIISSAHEGVIVYDREFRYVVWNRFMEELTGLPAEEVLGANAFEVFPHLREQGVDILLERALDGATIAAPDLTYYVPQSGKSGWISGTYAPYRNSRGEIVGVIAMVHDITERKLAEEALRKSEENFRAIFETAPDCIFIKDRALKYVLVNPSVEALFGKPAAEIVGLSDGELFGEDSGAADPRDGLPHPRRRDGRGRVQRDDQRRARDAARREGPHVRRRRGKSSASAVSPAISPRPGSSRPSSSRPRRWRPSGRSPAGSPTTSTTSSWASRAMSR